MKKTHNERQDKGAQEKGNVTENAGDAAVSENSGQKSKAGKQDAKSRAVLGENNSDAKKTAERTLQPDHRRADTAPNATCTSPRVAKVNPSSRER